MSTLSAVQRHPSPSSPPRFLSLDERVPPTVRKALEEATGCLEMGFMTGGAACARMAVSTIVHLEHAEDGDYAASLLALSEKHPTVPPALFQIVGMLGGGDEALNAEALRALIAAVKAIVYEIYVIGAERVERLMYVHELVETLKRAKQEHREA